MISLTQLGKTSLMQAMNDQMKTAHLMIDQGELQDHGYLPVKLIKSKWNDGVYPEIVWEFEAGQKEEVLGYFVNNINGDLLFSELFDRAFEIQHRGDRIAITIKIQLLGTGV